LQAHLKTAPANAKPKFLKELAKPAQEKNFKIFLLAKRKRIDKFNMKVQFDRNLRQDKNRQCITGGIFYCRDSADFSVSASNKLSCNLTVKCFEIGNKNIPPNVIGNTKKRKFNEIMTDFEQTKNALNFVNKLAIQEQESYKDLFLFVNEFKKRYDKAIEKLPYHINLIDELHANENAHSRILEKLLKQKTHNGKFEILESFISYIKEKGGNHFSKIQIKNPEITQEKERIDLWIRDNKSYAIIIENKVNYATDQEKQIERYINKTKSYGFIEENIFVLYLPPTYEKEPEQQSWGDYYLSDIKNERYLKLSFSDDILFWLRDYVLPNVRIKDTYLRSAIEQYIDHLEGIFSLRKINNNMNMELQKFIESELKLSEKEPEQAINSIIEKVEGLNNAITQLQLVREKYCYCCLYEWENRLKQDFPELKNEIQNNNKDKDYPNLGIRLNYKGINYSVLIEFSKHYKSGLTPYFGIGRHYASEQKEETITDFLKPYFSEKFSENNEWWYFWTDTSYKNGYERLKSLIIEMIKYMEK